MSPTMLLIGGAACLFVAVGLGLSVVGVVTQERRTSARTLAALKAIDTPDDLISEELERPFAERVIAPLGEQMLGLGRRLTRAETVERLQYKLDIAGNPRGWTINRLVGLKAMGLFAFAGLAMLFGIARNTAFAPLFLSALAAGGLGYLLPNILINNAGQKRERVMLNSLPDAVDLLTISVEAGLGFDAALARVAKETKGPLAGEFARLLQEMQIGVSRMLAMRAMAERTTLKEFKAFCLAMVQADAFGIGVGEVLRVQSVEMRAKRRARAEEAAHRVPVKLLFPLIFFILPTLFIMILGPVVLQAMAAFGSGN